MPSRRTHTKSRHGCTQCKAAHIKCDLSRPKCGRCTKTQRSCLFATGPRSHDPPSTVPSPAISPPNNVPQVLGLSESSETDIISWDDLELLHHFSTITYTTLSDRHDLREMWRIQIPKMALKQRFMMHSLFSVTALHIACSAPLESQSSYIDRAIRHHNIALRHLSAELHNITRENGASLFICATLIVVFSLNLAFSRPHQEPTGTVEEILGIFRLLRGVRLVLAGMWEWARESEIAPMFVDRDIDHTISLPGDVTAALCLLEERNRHLSKPASDTEAYNMAIQGLKDSFKVISSSNDPGTRLNRDDGMVLGWPITCNQEYIALLGSRQPLALVILAHYAVILHEMRDSWWVREWGSQLIHDVHQIVGDYWQDLMDWPIHRVSTGRPI
ncbi:uncharacterized protein PAC_02343 [Phialocephala subalpina]|uniref:Zn(2)-C6 fungal-type domain-containing protein n=1 Tax=Phialocephala subalpina TaxID=576137 RepID=A0A1L7WI81_9HELO|nr:uncharacterized protein PAC_02343 [Phialocephala subalpina]